MEIIGRYVFWFDVTSEYSSNINIKKNYQHEELNQ